MSYHQLVRFRTGDLKDCTIVKTPSELRVSKERDALTVTFPGNEPVRLSAEMLRVLSPSAEVQGHSPDQRVLVVGKENVTISNLEPIGHYAVRIVFSDGHSTGLFTWSYLEELAQKRNQLWADYLRELQEKGYNRKT
ncbi:hypothetical protein GCM10011385_05600 [Nitratireductor aestuarii]|uniref:Gamma-butyrobetaine hydroxylase-like N-terminal domain-containing protein n=1 Tax=Nitratireductor aestuarii TaxID=1735103 RepID=A0A916RG57_9HYPH|nr:hypothetical protein GCM10011385_05600 [Nitratireductor aestuarii]